MNQFYQPKILVVDDDNVLCELLSGQLQDLKFDTKFALNGTEAIKIIQTEEISLVILNVNMPFDMRGDEVLKKIKNYDPSLPVVMLSAQSDPAIIVKCIKLGADDYITKPYEYDDILDSIIKYIRIKK